MLERYKGSPQRLFLQTPEKPKNINNTNALCLIIGISSINVYNI